MGGRIIFFGRADYIFWAGGTPTPQEDLVFCGTGILPVLKNGVTRVFCGTGILPVLKNGVTRRFSFLWNRHLACSKK
ncbi:MAG: hypothetical protein EAZ09_18065 [Oscillatoriales cyanobacterium]|nr:MAG: hypothetical protein EAZ09_18065 [Oscillatoriales cyanobacterium]